MKALSASAGSVLLVSVATAAHGQIEGLWSGKEVNGPPMTPTLSIKLSTNSQGAVTGLKVMELPGTFTYVLSSAGHIYYTNQTACLRGTLSYDPQRDLLTYLPTALDQHQGLVVLQRDTNNSRNAELGLILGSRTDAEVTARLFPGRTNSGIDWSKITSAHKRAQPDGTANRGQPVGSETNRTSAAAGPGG